MQPRSEQAGKAHALRACPICGKPASAAHLPFCSSRCADVDLHRWLTGSYSLPMREDDPDDESRLDQEAPEQN